MSPAAVAAGVEAGEAVALRTGGSVARTGVCVARTGAVARAGVAVADGTGLGVTVAAATMRAGFFAWLEGCAAGVALGAMVCRGDAVASGVGDAGSVAESVGIALSLGVATGAAVTIGVSTGEGNGAIAVVSVFDALPPPKK